MLAFNPQGPIVSIASAANANAATLVAVQMQSLSDVPVQQLKMSNIDGTNDMVVGWGPDAANAAANAVAANGSPNCTYLMHSTIEVVTIPAKSFVTAILVGGTPTVKLQLGYGN